MDLNEITIFVKVVEIGSFIGAAQQLQMPKSTVSAKISALEARLGATLIRRTTRRLFVTDAGQDYYQQCVQALAQIAAAEEQVGQKQSLPQGLLRITAPVELGVTILPYVIAEFHKQYPEVRLEIMLSDRTVDLVSEGMDLAIRAGELKDSSLLTKKLGSVYFAPFASPKYLKKAGTPKSPKDLSAHRCIQFTSFGASDWELSNAKSTQFITLNKQMLSNDLNLIKSMAVAGVGIALLPTFFCFADSEAGRLQRILPEWRTAIRPVQFVYPQQDFVPKKLAVFLSVATDLIRDRLSSYQL